MQRTIFANRYQVGDQLGDGRSEVYKAFDPHLTREVALKVFPPGTSTIHVYGEASTLTALEGENVLRVFDASTFDDICYITAEVAALGSTEGLLRHNPRGFPLARTVSWIRQALVGLGACHDRGLVHRDVKPANIFLQTEHHALLGDFGLAHQIADDGSVPAEGTPHTIAPEMWTSGRGSRASDIFSMGVTAYRLMTGTWPFDGADRVAVRERIVAGRFAPLRDIAPHVSNRLAARITRAMAADPASRPTWREFHVSLGDADLVLRDWSRPRPHAGHVSCWSEIAPSGRTGIDVCVIASGTLVDVEVRSQGGAKHRLARKCSAGVRPRNLPVALRRLFDHL